MTLVLHIAKCIQQNFLLPWQSVCIPLQDPFAKQVLTVDPNKMNPLSQLNLIKLGYVVSCPSLLPFFGTIKEPQSTAARK